MCFIKHFHFILNEKEEGFSSFEQKMCYCLIWIFFLFLSSLFFISMFLFLQIFWQFFSLDFIQKKKIGFLKNVKEKNWNVFVLKKKNENVLFLKMKKNRVVKWKWSGKWRSWKSVILSEKLKNISLQIDWVYLN